MVSPDIHALQHPARLPSWPATFAIVALALAYLATKDWRDRHLVLINASASLPNWAFLVERGDQPQRGGYAVFAAARTPLIVAHFGKNPPPFTKIVYGVPGDMVTRADDWVSVNGTRIAHLKPFSKRGERLAPGPVGRVPQGCYYLGSPHPDGFDSRYADIGWVCARQIIGNASAVL